MSTEACVAGTVCRQRFKGVENFLKRLAFNLGNTPSQTEVKIISCIPIDVTDLQQKILNLERQLEEAKSFATQPLNKPSSKPVCTPKRTPVNTALYDSNLPRVSCAAISCKSLDCDQSTSPACLHSKKKSNVSFVIPSTNVDNGPQTTSNENSNIFKGTEDKPRHIETYKNDNTPKMSDPRQHHHENQRNFFKQRNKLFRNRKVKSPYIYYAQTNNYRFNNSDFPEELRVSKKDSDLMSRDYLTKMINKQYKPKLLGDNLSQLSQFSSPICRDTQPPCEGACRYESDVCSCCHGPFQNIDNQISKYNHPQTYMLNEMNKGSAYYDTNHYDLVPVKEKPVKDKKDIEVSRKKELKPKIDMMCWPENVRTKHLYYLMNNPPRTNYRVVRPTTEYIFKDNYVKKMPIKLRKIEPIAKKVTRRRRAPNKIDRPINIETSKSCSMDCGNIYLKKVYKGPKIQTSLKPIRIPQKNAECLTPVINNCECQTELSNLDENSSDGKTEATLNQIKSILQSVLAEVKVSSQTRNQVTEDKPKKDAVVQKGASQHNMQTSSLMNSITYSPYTMSPSPYMASCSRHLNSNQFCYPHSPLKCFQNFPLFIQTPGRHMCSCYRNSSHVRSGYAKQATTIATNTEELKEEHNKETETLIKEIYKSMALTMEMPNKDTSLSEYENFVKSVHDFASPVNVKTETKKQPKGIKNVVQAVSELFMKKDVIESSDTPTMAESKLPSNDASTRSQLGSTDTEFRIRKERLEKYLRSSNTQSTVDEAEERTSHKTMTHNATVITESESSSSDTESDDTLVLPKEVQEPKPKKPKKGLFSKMFKSVKLFKPKEKKKDEIMESEEETSSDSDDYQTIYSQKIDKNVKHSDRAHNLPKRKTHSKISYKQTYPRDRSPEKRKSPYMEQEYRRYWNERLMFHEKPKHSSEQRYSEETPQKSAYHRSYEARSAFLEPKTPHITKANPRETKMRHSRDEDTRMEPKLTTKGMTWLKKHKMGIHCGEQWRKLIMEG